MPVFLFYVLHRRDMECVQCQEKKPLKPPMHASSLVMTYVLHPRTEMHSRVSGQVHVRFLKSVCALTLPSRLQP